MANLVRPLVQPVTLPVAGDLFADLGGANGAPATPPTAVTLIAFPSSGGASAGVQRDIALTTGSPIFAGTYSGGTPTGMQGRVRKVSDNSVVTDWTDLSDVTIGGGSFSCRLAGVPQGAGYYRDVRAKNTTSVSAADATPFMVGIGLACYGQSNMGAMFAAASSLPAADANTAYFNGTNWVAVPNADGVRELLNVVQSVAGVPCFAVDGSVSGTGIAALAKGDASGYYDAFIAKVLAMQGAEFFLWRHGESAAAGSGMSEATYLGYLSQLHADLASDIGRTKAQIPGIASSLAWANESPAVYDNDKWDLVQRTLLDVETLASFKFSHSNMDAVLLADHLHQTGADCLKSADRYARSITTLLGVTTGYPKWDISSAATVNSTTTTVTLAHGLGSDFTPTSGITGFEISGDNGGTWAACTGVRTDATTITLTHASVATTNARKLRYQYGKSCDVSALVLDNSSLAVPLLMSAGNISPTPLATLPTPTWRSGGSASGSATQTLAAQSIGPAAAGRMVILSYTVDSQLNGVDPTITITPNVGTAKVMTKAIAGTQNTTPLIGMYYAVLDADADAATTVDISIVFPANPFNGANVNIWTVPSTDLSSTAPVDAKYARASAATGVSVTTLSTSAGGFVCAAAVHGTLATTGTWTGSTETITMRRNASANSGEHMAGDCSNNTGNAGNFTVQANFPVGNDNCGVVAVAWR